MIYHQGQYELTGRYKMDYTGKWRVVTEVYKGARLVWTAIRSCFGAGFWVREKPWLGDEPWKR